MKQKFLISVYLSILALFIIICVLSVFELFRGNSLADEVSALKGGPSSLSQIKKLQSDLDSEQQVNRDLSSKLDDLNNKYQQMQSNYSNLQQQVSQIQQTRYTNDSKKRIAYLTFDDGPSKLTSQLLDTLKANGIHATFFVVGTQLVDYPDVVKRAYQEGNVIGVHSWTHKYSYIYSSEKNFFVDFDELKDYLTNLLGTQPDVCRYPGGTNNTVSQHYSDHIMRKIVPVVTGMGIREFDWDVDAGDADAVPATKDQIISNVMNNAVNYHHPIILCHDLGTKTTTIEAIPDIIAGLKAHGYSFGVLSASVNGTEFKPV